MNTFDGCCGSCENLNTNDYVRTKDHCYCTVRRQYYDLREPKCRYYRYDRYKDYYDLNHRWYIVTVIFDKLGLKDEYECISILHNFRNDVLSKDPKYEEILGEYDIVGPEIAKLLAADENSLIVCKDLAQILLLVLDNIKAGKNDEALELYIKMVNTLIKKYNVDVESISKEKKSK